MQNKEKQLNVSNSGKMTLPQGPKGVIMYGFGLFDTINLDF